MKVLKIAVILTLVMGLLLGAAVPALADSETASPQLTTASQFGEGGRGPWPWDWGKARIIRGVVDTVAEGVITLESGAEIYVDEETRFMGGVGGLEDIESGIQIVVLGGEQDDQFYTRWISVIPVMPRFGHNVGEVIAYEPGESLTLENKEGDEITFDIIDDLRIMPSGAAIEVGKWVTVISRRDSDDSGLISVGVMVHPLRPFFNRCIQLCRLFTKVRLQELERVVGTVDVEGTTLIIDPTPDEDDGDEVVLLTDDKTIVILRGVLSLADGQTVMAFYKEEDDTNIAKVVLAGVELSEIICDTSES